MASIANGQIYTGCPSDTNYVRGCVFGANLDALLSSLPAATASPSGFARNATGAAADEAYGSRSAAPTSTPPTAARASTARRRRWPPSAPAEACHAHLRRLPAPARQSELLRSPTSGC
ncbi:hypothetical protein ACP4OV_028734 [Aristida adscensionis]